MCVALITVSWVLTGDNWGLSICPLAGDGYRSPPLDALRFPTMMARKGMATRMPLAEVVGSQMAFGQGSPEWMCAP